jgi:hypothetical protein
MRAINNQRESIRAINNQRESIRAAQQPEKGYKGH